MQYFYKKTVKVAVRWFNIIRVLLSQRRVRSRQDRKHEEGHLVLRPGRRRQQVRSGRPRQGLKIKIFLQISVLHSDLLNDVVSD